ncbi:OmpA family protein [Xylophilus rhododendri]|uniref:OmpA family protein n=1 Tax=Xylophilus rhododendri TaxID=2697032 RepID=A0A857J7H0_9BURK|nr:OmpA family protein [Xylophilus rhododendri]QHI98718.1 OmpA family protein [Xylophilus rhododendri]
MRKLILAGTAAAVLLVTGCADMNMSDTQRRTAVGAGAGAAGGAVIGALAGGGNAGKGALIGAGVGALGTYIWSERMEKQKRDMQAATQGTGIAVSQTSDNQLKLDVPSDVSFDTGKANVKSNFAPVLDRFATSLQGNPGATVRIVGHTDNTGSDAVNDPLSVSRAAATRDYIVMRGIDSRRFEVEGRGSHQPIASNDSAAGRAQNRRVEIFIGEQGRS